jgi:hypothetical protein
MKMNPIVKVTFGAGVAAALLFGSQSAKATLFAYEGFDYGVGNLAGQSGGSGWSAAWAQNGGNVANSQVIGSSFSFMDSLGNTLVTSGNRAWMTGDGSATGDNIGGANSSASPLRTLTTIRGNSGLTESTWISFLALRVGNPNPTPGAAPNDYLYGRAASVQLFYNATTTSTAQGNEQVSIGRGTQSSETVNTALPNDTWAVLQQGNANATVASSLDFYTAPADFILMRIDHVGANTNSPGDADTLRMWINPTDLTVAPNDADAVIAFSSDLFAAAPQSVTRDFVFDRIRIFAGNGQTTPSGYSYGSIQLDELRIADTFADVTPYIVPEPAVAALLGFAGLAFVMRFRRK